MYFFLFFFNDTATTEIYTLSLHDALPIYFERQSIVPANEEKSDGDLVHREREDERSEEHTSELQSRLHLVCRLLLEKKKKTICTEHLRGYMASSIILVDVTDTGSLSAGRR